MTQPNKFVLLVTMDFIMIKFKNPAKFLIPYARRQI